MASSPDYSLLLDYHRSWLTNNVSASLAKLRGARPGVEDEVAVTVVATSNPAVGGRSGAGARAVASVLVASSEAKVVCLVT